MNGCGGVIVAREGRTRLRVYSVPRREGVSVRMIPCGGIGSGGWEKFRGRSRERFERGMRV